MREGLLLEMVQRVANLALVARTAAGRVPVLAQRRKKGAIAARRCARATKVLAVRGRTNVAMSTSISAEGAPTETERTGARGWMSMSIAGADPADGMSTSTCGAMGIPLLAAKSCCAATSNAPPADKFCSGAPQGGRRFHSHPRWPHAQVAAAAPKAVRSMHPA